MSEFRAVPATDDRFVWMSGELDTRSADEFAAATAGAIRAGGAIVLDLTRLTFIDSDGIRAMLSAIRQVAGRGCLVLHNPTPHVAKVLSIVGFATIPGVHLLDARHADVAPPDGPGAWSRTAAFRHLVLDTDDLIRRATQTARRSERLLGRSASLLVDARRLRTVCRSWRMAAAAP